MNDRGTEPNERTDERNLTGEISVRRSPLADWTARIVVVFLAFILWFYVMATSSQNVSWVIEDVPVRIENGSSLSVLSGDGVTVDVTVLGRRSVKKNLTAADVSAYVTVPEDTVAGKYTFDIQVDPTNGLTVDALSQSRLSVYLDNTATTTVPVRAKITEFMLETDYDLDMSGIVCNPSSLRVTGPESVLDTIDCAQVIVELGRVTGSVNYNGAAVLVDASGAEVTSSYLKAAASAVTVTVPVFKYRDLPLNVSFRYGFLNRNNANVTVEPASVRIRGKADIVDTVEWSYTVDEKNVFEKGEYNVALRLPNGVTAVGGEQTVRISVEPVGMPTRTVTIRDFTVSNPGNADYSLLTDSLAVVLRGPDQVLRYLTPAAITAIVDLSQVSESSGTVSIPVSFTFAPGYGGVYELGTYAVTVRMG